MDLHDEAAAAFARDGVACVRSVLDPGEVAEAAAAIDEVLARPGQLAVVASAPDDPGAFTEDFCRWQEIPRIERLARHSRVPAVAAALMATPRVRFYHDHVLVKEGGTRQRTPWHQDQPYYNVDGRGVSAWIPVDPVPSPRPVAALPVRGRQARPADLAYLPAVRRPGCRASGRRRHGPSAVPRGLARPRGLRASS